MVPLIALCSEDGRILDDGLDLSRSANGMTIRCFGVRVPRGVAALHSLSGSFGIWSLPTHDGFQGPSLPRPL